ncbi:AlbA family DNA-binding domain-containing protein [Neomicrococcus lactis]|uniref:Schlafen AlbA-2 domain-containing protein n=1 Tax=Neomicrococcus lactis TaxID=732241 RepID=A0A7W8YBT7_9MICC|nr:ATP-binding protein [Neomicrococcus lactis]MBB5598663.1 hypothetical protein [Neomicrococcus lactis]
MFTPIHRILGIEPNHLDADILQKAINAEISETSDLDWKRNFYPKDKPNWQDEAAKDIAAMANSGGGWIFFGVGENDSTSSAAEITPIEWNAGEEQRLRQVAYAKIGPPIIGIEFFPIPFAQKFVIAARIPDSPDRPHLAKKGENAFIAPLRNGPHTVFMTEREVETAYRHRFYAASENEQELKSLLETSSGGLDPLQGVILVSAALPLEKKSANPKIDDATFRTFTYNNQSEDLYAQPFLAKDLWSEGEIRKGMRSWILRNPSGDNHHFRKTFHDNGTIQASYRLGNLTRRHEAINYYPVDEPNHCLSEDIEEAIINIVASVRSWAKLLGVQGGYRLRLALVGNNSEPIWIRSTENTSGSLRPKEHSDPIHHFIPVDTEFDPLSATEFWLPQVVGLTTDVINQGGVRYLMVMADSD